MRSEINWLSQKLWRWDVVAVLAAVLYGAGIAAMYGDDYIIACCLYCVAVIWVTAKALTWEETTGHQHRKGVSILILVLAAVVLAVSLAWVSHRYETSRAASGHPPTGVITAAVVEAWRRIRGQAWLRPFIAGAVITLLLTFGPRIWRAIGSKAANIASAPAQKGFLDYKFQAEESVLRLGPLLVRMTKIVEKIGASMEAHTLRVAAVQSSPARVQVQAIRRAAKDLDGYSARLDAQCIELEEVGNSMVEGLAGWLTWFREMKDNPAIQAAANQMAAPLAQLATQTSGALVNFDRYLRAVESLHGTSQDMNAAVDRHLRSFGRVRAVTDNIRRSCQENAQLLAQFGGS